MSTAATAEALAPPDRGIRYFLRNQTPWSSSVLIAGISTLVFYVVGTIAVLTAFGWSTVCPEGASRLDCSPSDPLAQGLQSDGLGMVAWIAVVVGVALAAIAFATFRYMPNKPARSAVIAGGVLAIQAVLLAAFLLWFRGSDVDRFARNFLNFSLIGSRTGLIWSSISEALDRILIAGAATAAIFATTVAALGHTRHEGWRPVSLPTLIGLGGGAAQGLADVVLSDNGITHILGRSIFWGLVGFAVGMAIAGAFGWVRIARSREWKPALVAGGLGLGIGLIGGIISTSTAPSFVKGAQNTLILSGAGAALGFGLGLVLALQTLSSRAVVRAPARVYINFFRGTPLLWQISFAGVGFVPAMRLDLSMYTIAILVLGLNLAAYSAEVYRAGIQSLERGQIEGARTLGLSYFKSMRYVVVPQAIRRVIPPLLNEFVILVKDTSLVSVLGLTVAQKELLGVGRDIYSSSFDATAWLGSAAGYLIITLPMIAFVTVIERRLRSGLTSVIG